MNNYIPRLIEDDVRKSAKTIPVIALTGPRQSGKTTLAKALFSDYLYQNLEFPDIRAFAENDPRKFLQQSKLMIIDEIQRVPMLFSYIQGLIDEDKSIKYVLTGSNNFALIHKITQSLAGRVALFTVLPFSLNEIKHSTIPLQDLSTSIINGWYPRVLADKNDPQIWYKSYIQTYLERDVRDLVAVQSIDRFYSFIRILAIRSGSILNYTEIAKEVGVALNTIKDWVSILRASYIIYTLQPFHSNIKKRLVKSPKFYFYDTGLLCSLLNINNPEALNDYPNYGIIFENFIISEYFKLQAVKNFNHSLLFYRDHNGREVDLIREQGSILELFEIKSNRTFNSNSLDTMRWFNENIKPAQSHSVVYGGDLSHSLNSGHLISWQDIT